MKIKIQQFKELEQKKAKCNFCGEKKTCIKGDSPNMASYAKTSFDFPVDYGSSNKLKEVVTGYSSIKIYSYICFDCIRQLAKIGGGKNDKRN